MSKYRNNLPQLSDSVFLTDGGLETSLIFDNGYELPSFAAFDVLKNEEGKQALDQYYRRYVSIARRHRLGFILESATWRASAAWGKQLGYSAESLAQANRDAIVLLQELRNEYESENTKIVISGCVGSKGDGYNPTERMTETEAEEYHSAQMRTLSETDVDMVAALTMAYAEEAIGVTRAAKAVGLPVVISFTVETDGRLPTGQALKDAIEQVDDATDSAPAYYMINCAHPTHFKDAIEAGEAWIDRIRGVRANASPKSHAELDESTELDAGDPIELGRLYKELRDLLPKLNVLGGCCGTDHRHVEEVSKRCATRY